MYTHITVKFNWKLKVDIVLLWLMAFLSSMENF